jgi:hypothetical protein
MQNYEQAVFISYAWGDEREKIVNQLDETLQKHGVKIVRDKRDLGYKGSISEFMERIGQGNCVIVVISDKYLRSPNCMFELVEIAENKQFYDRVFPVILADANIYDAVKRIEYVKYWEVKRAELAEAIKSLDPANLQGIRDDMDLYDRIRDKVSGLTSILKDMNTLTPEMHLDSDFDILYTAIERRMHESPLVPTTGVATEANILSGVTSISGAPSVAAGGLAALAELMRRSPIVHAEVNGFQSDLKAAYEQVNRLGDYKDLHDQLHKLQFHCYNGVVQAVSRFPDDELTLDSLTDHALTLEGIVEELKQVAGRPSMPKQELTWIEDLGLAKAELRNAVDALDVTSLKKVVWRLNRLLATQPARINALLNYSAHALHLPELLSALTSICITLTSLELDANNVAAFQSGVDALGELNRNLSSLVDDHDHWQAVDVELRRIEASIDHDLVELEMSWPDIKLRAEPLYIDNTEEWAIALKGESDSLDGLLRDNNPSKVRRGFRSYQRRVTDRFYRVDIKLKALCGDMRQIGTPLAAVLEMIYDYS